MDEIHDTINQMNDLLTKFHLIDKNKDTQKCKQIQLNLEDKFQTLSEMVSQLTLDQRSKLQSVLKQKQNELQEVQRQITGINDKFNNVESESVTSYKKMKVAENYNQDSVRNAHEAAETGNAIVEKLAQQNQQLRGVGNTLQHIGQNTIQGSKLIETMQRKERMVNFTLYGIVAVLIILDCVAFWVFHSHKDVQSK